MLIQRSLRADRAGRWRRRPALMGLLPIILMFVLLYFLMIRPQMKRAKEHKAMTDALQKGDEVVTAGGMLGKITKVSDAYITLEIAAEHRDQCRRRRCRPCCPRARSKSIYVTTGRRQPPCPRSHSSLVTAQ